MRRWRWLLAGLVATTMWVAPGAGADPAQHFEFDITEDPILDCTENGQGLYEGVAGVIRITAQENQAKSGNESFTFTATPKGVVLVDEDGNEYSLRGAVWGGGNFNAQQETGGGTFTAKLNIVAKGQGVVDSVNITAHESPNGKGFEFDIGTCAF